MFKKSRLVEGIQDTYSRKVFVVSPKESLIQDLVNRDSRLERFREALYRPAVFFTPEVPFESRLEGYSSGLKRIIRRSFLERYKQNTRDDLPFIHIPDETFADDTSVEFLFEQWWTIREAADYAEFLDGAWISE